MSEELLNSDVAKEVLTILLYSNKDIQDKIPESIIKQLSNLAADSKITVNLVKNKKLNEQKVSEEALDIFSLLYISYVSNDEEKQKVLSQWLINDNSN